MKSFIARYKQAFLNLLQISKGMFIAVFPNTNQTHARIINPFTDLIADSRTCSFSFNVKSASQNAMMGALNISSEISFVDVHSKHLEQQLQLMNNTGLLDTIIETPGEIPNYRITAIYDSVFDNLNWNVGEFTHDGAINTRFFTATFTPPSAAYAIPLSTNGFWPQEIRSKMIG